MPQGRETHSGGSLSPSRRVGEDLLSTSVKEMGGIPKLPINLEKWVTFKGEEQAAKQSASPRHELGMFRENGAGLRGAPTGLGQGDGPHHQLAGTKAGVAPTTELPI